VKLTMRSAHDVKKTTQAAERNIIGKRIREARQKAKSPISQDALSGKLAARGITIDQTALSRIEKQQRYLMDYEIQALARCLKVSVAWLFGETSEPVKRTIQRRSKRR
jgi:HTH-type transcriptional regulator, cell division transcriptional repressor